jgi:hypothetical protein
LVWVWRALTSLGWGLVKSSTAEQQTEGVKLLQGGSTSTLSSPSSSSFSLPGPKASYTLQQCSERLLHRGWGTSTSDVREIANHAHAAQRSTRRPPHTGGNAHTTSRWGTTSSGTTPTRGSSTVSGRRGVEPGDTARASRCHSHTKLGYRRRRVVVVVLGLYRNMGLRLGSGSPLIRCRLVARGRTREHAGAITTPTHRARRDAGRVHRCVACSYCSP